MYSNEKVAIDISFRLLYLAMFGKNCVATNTKITETSKLHELLATNNTVLKSQYILCELLLEISVVKPEQSSKCFIDT